MAAPPGAQPKRLGAARMKTNCSKHHKCHFGTSEVLYYKVWYFEFEVWHFEVL